MNDAPRAAVSLPLWRVERILYDDQGLLVVDKPIGMPVHGGDESLSHSVVERLGSWLQAQGRRRYLGVHQRLDQDTSGVLLFVTDEAKNAAVVEALEARQLRRIYRAVLAPAREKDARAPRRPPLLDSGIAEISLGFDGQRAWVSDTTSPSFGGARGSEGRRLRRGDAATKRATTRYRVLRREGDRLLVEFELETGRTHQIRVTMAHLGFPVVGDHLYGGQPGARMMLHAVELSGAPLRHPIRSDAPTCFDEALRGGQAVISHNLEEAILDAATLRAPLVDRTNTFRLINGEGDGLPAVTVDVYGAYLTLNLYNSELDSLRGRITSALLSLGYQGVYEKKRVRADLRTQDAGQLAPQVASVGTETPEILIVQENGMNIEVDLTDGLSTGLFVDMREGRARVRDWAGGGTTMLNLFCYTSSFGVAAALGGATTTNVDVSAKALNRSRRNFEINDLDPTLHRFFKEDAMKFLARANRRGDRYHLIVLDPPSFATVGKGTFSVKSLYGQAVLDCLKLLENGGRLLCVTNHTKTTPRSLRATVEAAAEAAGRRLRLIKALPSALDCPPDAFGPWPSKSLIVQVED
jgi:23S rRNA (cytosine1962-C5)-methyltransferase